MLGAVRRTDHRDPRPARRCPRARGRPGGRWGGRTAIGAPAERSWTGSPASSSPAASRPPSTSCPGPSSCGSRWSGGAAGGLPAFGSCAGMIMLADRLVDAPADQQTFGGMDITVRRNAFGRQTDSFEADLDGRLAAGRSVPGRVHPGTRGGRVRAGRRGAGHRAATRRIRARRRRTAGQSAGHRVPPRGRLATPGSTPGSWRWSDVPLPDTTALQRRWVATALPRRRHPGGAALVSR